MTAPSTAVVRIWIRGEPGRFFTQVRFRHTTCFVARETISGEPVNEEQVQAWADEAERGYLVERLRRGGRPAVGDGLGEVIAVRMDETLLAALTARAAYDDVSRS